MRPVTKDNMNYTSAALGVVGVVSFLTWITTGRKMFTGPCVDDSASGIKKGDGEVTDKSHTSSEVVKAEL